MTMVDGRFDVVIIGSGVGGLICGNYLTKMGFRTLIVEQHYFIGGCCSLYRRHGFIFDVGVHYLGCFRQNGFMRRVVEDLGILDELKIRRINPTDLVLFPDRQVYFWNDHGRTVSELQEQFPDEAVALKDFFELLLEEDLLVLAAKIRGRSFEQLLRDYFKSAHLKSVFIAFLGNMGLPSSLLAGITGVILFRDYILDGGYYPTGGTHKFTEVLRRNFEKNGGVLRTRCLVTKIDVKDKRVQGVLLRDGSFIECKNVVSNADARQTFLDLVGLEHTPTSITRSLKRLVPSTSAFIIYLGLKKTEAPVGNCSNIWYCRNYEIDRVYFQNFVRKELNFKDFIFCSFPSVDEPGLAPPGFETAHLLVLAPTKDENYWREHRDEITEQMIALAKNVRPHITDDIIIKEPATPLTIQRFTQNLGGSIYGWASTSSQIDPNDMPQRSPIEGLYLAGHWVTKPTGQGGVTMATYAGRHAAHLIRNSSKKRSIAITGEKRSSSLSNSGDGSNRKSIWAGVVGEKC